MRSAVPCKVGVNFNTTVHIINTFGDPFYYVGFVIFLKGQVVTRTATFLRLFLKHNRVNQPAQYVMFQPDYCLKKEILLPPNAHSRFYDFVLIHFKGS